jgi:hypothetical protein
MKQNSPYKFQNVGFFILCLLIFISCDKHGEHKYHGVTDKIKAESKHYNGTTISSDKYLEGLDLMEVTENGQTFFIPKRKEHIKSFNCTECHSEPLEKLKKGVGQKAHWDLKLNHANAQIMNCTTCHNGSNMDQLTSLTGQEIDLNNSYNLCSQCHTTQFKDWTGGAHGKKIKSWAPPRASLTCVNCHNPHNPSFDSRWPARFNTQTEKERK